MSKQHEYAQTQMTLRRVDVRAELTPTQAHVTIQQDPDPLAVMAAESQRHTVNNSLVNTATRFAA